MPSRDERLSSHSGCKGRSVRNSFARQRLNCRSAALLASTALVAVAAFAPRAARAQDTWRPTPASGDFNTAINWSPVGVPAGTAFFGQSDITALTFSANTTVGGWTFNTGAPAYTFSNNRTLQFNGAGIVLIGGSVSINNNLFLNFFGASAAGSATINNSGIVSFFGDTNAGDASIVNNGIPAVRRQEHGRQRRHRQRRR